MKKVLLIATGGTIASHSGKDGLIPQLKAEEILKIILTVLVKYGII